MTKFHRVGNIGFFYELDASGKIIALVMHVYRPFRLMQRFVVHGDQLAELVTSLKSFELPGSVNG